MRRSGSFQQSSGMAMRICTAAFGILVCNMGLLHAEPATGSRIRELFTGNTVSGVYVGGNRFSEFHAADGRVLGDNGYTLNVDACWNTDSDRVCYHYGPKEDRRTYCFTVEVNDTSYNLRVAGSGRLNAVAAIEKGNPKQHGDGGKRWSCDDLLARDTGGQSPVATRLSRFPASIARGVSGWNARAERHDFDTNHSLRVYPLSATIRP